MLNSIVTKHLFPVMEDIATALLSGEESVHDDDDAVPKSPSVMDDADKADGETAHGDEQDDDAGDEIPSNKTAEAGDEATPNGNDEISAATLDNE